MDGRFVLLAMSERALSNDFQQMCFSQKQSCVKYFNLQNDIPPNICSHNISFSTKA
jgi:hypothetical protein